jgi:hypothetical protein
MVPDNLLEYVSLHPNANSSSGNVNSSQSDSLTSVAQPSVRSMNGPGGEEAGGPALSYLNSSLRADPASGPGVDSSSSASSGSMVGMGWLAYTLPPSSIFDPLQLSSIRLSLEGMDSEWLVA